jgi:hypothetical protein
MQSTGDADAELEAKLEKLRQARGRTPRGQGTKAEERSKKEAGGWVHAPPTGLVLPGPLLCSLKLCP